MFRPDGRRIGELQNQRYVRAHWIVRSLCMGNRQSAVTPQWGFSDLRHAIQAAG